jgi:hypothetical protein
MIEKSISRYFPFKYTVRTCLMLAGRRYCTPGFIHKYADILHLLGWCCPVEGGGDNFANFLNFVGCGRPRGEGRGWRLGAVTPAAYSDTNSRSGP